MNAYTLRALPELGVDVSELGCVMLDVEPIDLGGVIPPEWEYHSPDPAHRWVSGVQTGGQHITLLYGLLRNANTIREHVDEVLDGWSPGGRLAVFWVDTFPSTFPDEDYVCLVGRLAGPTEPPPFALRDAHQRLSMLPHVNTHREYVPHVTFAYVRREFAAAARDALAEVLPVELRVIGLNYGRQPGAES